MSTTSGSFVELLEKSQLISSEEIDAIRSSNVPADAKVMAQRLVKEKQVTRWQAAMLLRGRHSFRLGKYRLLEPLSSSELGDIYLAEHERMGRRVAIHILSRHVTGDATRVERFLSQSQEVAKLDHRNIIHVYDIDREGDRYIVVMEYREGTDLETVLKEAGRVPGEQAADCIRQALDALAYAHEHDVCHLGLRPCNISVDEQGTVKVRDFGMASLAASLASTDDKNAAEKNQYAAPEQRGVGEIDHRVDICSLGIIGFQILTGQLPTATAKRTNATIEKIFRKMMAKRPDDRFQTAADASAYLEKWLTKYRLQKCFAVSNAEQEGASPPKFVAKQKSETTDEFALAIGETESVACEMAITSSSKPVDEADQLSSEREPNGARKAKPKTAESAEIEEFAEPVETRTGLIIGIIVSVTALIIIGLVVAVMI